MEITHHLVKWGYLNGTATGCGCGALSQTLVRLLSCPPNPKTCSQSDFYASTDDAVEVAMFWAYKIELTYVVEDQEKDKKSCVPHSGCPSHLFNLVYLCSWGRSTLRFPKSSLHSMTCLLHRHRSSATSACLLYKLCYETSSFSY